VQYHLKNFPEILAAEARAPNALERRLETFVGAAQARNLRLAIVGLGYVGLPLAEAFVAAGFRTFGLEANASKIDMLAAGRSYVEQMDDARIAEMFRGGRFEVSAKSELLSEADVFLVCVPTPVDHRKAPDLTCVLDAARLIGDVLRPGCLVVVESTVYPGATEQAVKPVLEDRSGLRAGVDFALAYSPERVDAGNAAFPVTAIPKVIGADSDPERTMVAAVYGEIVRVVPVSNMRTAESVKVLESAFRLVNIGLVNELKSVYAALDVDIWEAIAAASTKPFGFMPFFPGPGVGGHCIPVDPHFLVWQARACGLPLRLIETAGEIAEALPNQVVAATIAALKERLAPGRARVLILGVAYKPGVADTRESPALQIIEGLLQTGAAVDYFDPHVPLMRLPPGGDGASRQMRSIAWSRERLSTYDCAVIVTDHGDVDYRMALAALPLIVDTRNATAPFMNEYGKKIVRA